MDERKIEFVDQSIHDAQQSLWEFRMPTDMINEIAPVMDRVGYKAIGVTGDAVLLWQPSISRKIF